MFSSLGTAALDVFSRTAYAAAGLVDVCVYVCGKQQQILIFFPRLIDCYCSCRKLDVDQRVSTGVLVPRRRC